MLGFLYAKINYNERAVCGGEGPSSSRGLFRIPGILNFCEGSLTPSPAAEAWAGRRVSVPLEHWITLLAAEAAAVELEAAESPAAASS